VRRTSNSGGRAGSRWTAILWAALVAVFILSRLPLLHLGYGIDDDAWAMAGAADTLAATGRYIPSRLPGYPSAELYYAGAFRLFGSGWTVGNGAAALAGLLGMAAVALALRRSDPALRLLAAAALAFHPAFWIASATTLDFVVCTSLVAGLVLALFAERPLLAGALLGLAAGARITAVLAWIPGVIYLLAARRDRRGAALFTAAGAVVTAALFSLPFAAAGPGFLSYAAPLHRDYLIGAYKVYRDLVGAPLLLAAVALAVRRLVAGRSGRGPGAARRDPRVWLLAGTAALLTVPFILLPADATYLLPLVPLAILLLAILAENGTIGRRAAAALLVAMTVFSFAGVGEVDARAWREEHRIRVHWLEPGRIFQEAATRREILRRARRAAAASFPPHSLVILGRPFYPWKSLGGRPPRELVGQSAYLPATDTLVVRILWPELLARERGRRIYYAAGEDLPYLTRRIFGYSLRELGAVRLELW